MLDKNYTPSIIEKKFYELWEASNWFKVGTQKGTPYTIIMPPANVTGNLHVGHALTFTIQDILIRFHRMLGYDVLWQPGTDHAGIATQMVVERQLEKEGVSRREMGREAFIERVWDWKAESGGAIISQLKRLGASADWSRERFTMDPHANSCVTKVFVDLYNQGLIYKDKRLVNWDIKYQTAISDLEVEQREQTDKFYYLKYPLEKGGTISVATTRPETFFGDVAVAVHPSDERYQHLIGQYVILPLVNRRIPIIGDEHGNPEKGTGAVKITPAHDFDDFEVAKRHNLEMISILDEDGFLSEVVPEPYRGLDVSTARRKVAATLEALDLIEKIEQVTHSVPYGGSGMVIEPRLTDQWYVDAKALSQSALAAVEKEDTTFFPTSWTKVYFEWLNNIQPWCISRQIWWGHSIPAWYGPDGQVFVALDCREAHLQAQTHYGKEIELVQDPDVLDTWFSSALWPFVTLGWPEETPLYKTHYPTDVLVTGFDIIFFWVARMMMMGLHFTKKVPFKNVYIHALVRDSKGQKMSKSKGNVMDPIPLIETYGADALRFTLASLAAPGRDIKLSEEKVAASRNFATKFWNATRYALMNKCHIEEEYSPSHCTHTLNQWIVSEIKKIEEDTQEAFKNYRFHEAAQGLYHFLWKTVCDWYLEFTKPILMGADQKIIEETRRTIAWVMGQVCHLLHPIMPFITEEIWKGLGGKNLLIGAAWPSFEYGAFTDAQAEINWIIEVISEIRSLRSELNINPVLLLSLSLSEGGPVVKENLQKHREILQRLARLKPIEFTPSPSSQTLEIIVPQATFLLSVDGALDISAEFTRLTKEIEKLEKELLGLEIRLNNPEFLSKAPENIIQELTERKSNFELLKSKNLKALKKLKKLT